MSADWSKGVEELLQAWQSDPLNARAAFLAYRDYLAPFTIRCVSSAGSLDGWKRF